MIKILNLLVISSFFLFAACSEGDSTNNETANVAQAGSDSNCCGGKKKDCCSGDSHSHANGETHSHAKKEEKSCKTDQKCSSDKESKCDASECSKMTKDECAAMCVKKGCSDKETAECLSNYDEAGNWKGSSNKECCSKDK